MSPVLDDLLNDDRLARLFSQDALPCALQLWVLQIKTDQSVENRVIYGRLLPYSYANEQWTAGHRDYFEKFEGFHAQIARITLYVSSAQCPELLRQLSAGQSVTAISDELKLGLSDQLKKRFGTTALDATGLVYRPVAYLLNRDAYERRGPSSPHGGSGAFSASITQTTKQALFRVGQDYDAALTALIVKQLDTDTGLDFGGTDITRLGDLELLVFPALDDEERQLLDVSWIDVPPALVARFNPVQVPRFNGFQFRLNITNGDQIIYSSLTLAQRDAEGPFEGRFELSEQLRSRTDSTELEIFGFQVENPRQSLLCCRWRVSYVREIHIQSHALGLSRNAVKFDWLERTARPSATNRVKAALTIDRGSLGFANRIGERKADPWVPVNRDLASLFARLRPPRSDGQFFLRRNQGDGDGRLQFVEWFKTLLQKYRQHQVVIFDPYFEAAGLGLIAISATPDADYIVFTSLPKAKEKEETCKEYGDRALGRINNLMAGCEHSRPVLRSIKLRIFGLKAGRLHDRYILVLGQEGIPVAGFNLSNSLQKATENHPLLVTPIPADVLLKVEQYKSGLMQEAQATQLNSEADGPLIRLLFDSALPLTAMLRYEPLRFLEMRQAGDVIAAWADEPSLKGLSGDLLKVKMDALGLLKENSLALPQADGLRKCLRHDASAFADFSANWEVIGEVLAHSHAEAPRFRELASEHKFLNFLARFLKASFNRTHDEEEKELAVMRAWFFREPIESLLYSSYRPHNLIHPTKYAALTWAEFYSIKFLWWFAPDALLAIFEAQVVGVPVEAEAADVVGLSLLSQIASEVSLSIQFDMSAVQLNHLIRSSSGLLQWMGLNAIEQQLEEPNGTATVVRSVATFLDFEKVRALGWMVNHAAGDPAGAETYKDLVTALHAALPAELSAADLSRLVDSMRGHMKRLAWAEPWLFRDVVFPLLESERAKNDDACEIWIQELDALLEPDPRHGPRLFIAAREGQTTNVAAFLFAYSSPAQQEKSLSLMRAHLARQMQILHQPLASTSNWARWDDALTVSMWVLSFARWGQYYLQGRGLVDQQLEKLSADARGLAMVRPMDEWRSTSTGKRGELATFLDQVDLLLAPSDGSLLDSDRPAADGNGDT